MTDKPSMFERAKKGIDEAHALVRTANSNTEAALAEIGRLRKVIADLKAWAQDFHDTVDNSDGTPGPNWAMDVTNEIERLERGRRV